MEAMVYKTVAIYRYPCICVCVRDVLKMLDHLGCESASDLGL